MLLKTYGNLLSMKHFQLKWSQTMGTFPLFPRQFTNASPNPNPNSKPNNGFRLTGLTGLLGFIMVYQC